MGLVRGEGHILHASVPSAYLNCDVQEGQEWGNFTPLETVRIVPHEEAPYEESMTNLWILPWLPQYPFTI